ncbi:MAG: hypothetical protein H6574_17980 [Lewinellaceae bacterium]|nr:hypothetical protein [Saprospiraceae bacterium]MCB9332961.1 hypothetical protein [Lewinellaceae bacterium]
MFRLILFAGVTFCLLQACNPPVRLKPANVKTGLDSTFYAGVVEDAKTVDLREARFLAKIKVGDLGVSLDCDYPDILDLATSEVRRIGGNLLVLQEHTRNKTKSNCHRIKGEIYQVASLEGLEPHINWNPARLLLPGDLRGKVPTSTGNGLPPLHTEISCRIGGDYFKEAILRTETLFWTDSTYRTGDAAFQEFLLRRAQLYFDLAELHARKLKSRLADLGADVTAITGQFREMTIQQKELLRREQQSLEDEFAKGSRKTVLERWENRVKADLTQLAGFGSDIVVDLRKQKKRRG